MLSLGARYMIASAFALSAMTLMVKLVGQRIPSQEIVLARGLFSLVVSYGLLRRAGLHPWGRHKGLLFLRGTMGACGLLCVFYAVPRLPLAEATVIQYLNPIFTALLAAALLGEHITRRLAIALAVCTVGILLVSRPGFLFGSAASGFDRLALAAALAGALFSSAAYTTVRRIGASEHPLVIVMYFPLVSVPLTVPLVVPTFVMPQGWDWLLLLGVGLGAQVGQIFLTNGIRRMPAGRAMSIGYLQIVFAATWGLLVFREVPDPLTIVGSGLIIGGTVLVSRRRAGDADAD